MSNFNRDELIKHTAYEGQSESIVYCDDFIWAHQGMGTVFLALKTKTQEFFFDMLKTFGCQKRTLDGWFKVPNIFSKCQIKKILSGVYARKIVIIPYACFLFHVWHL